MSSAAVVIRALRVKHATAPIASWLRGRFTFYLFVYIFMKLDRCVSTGPMRIVPKLPVSAYTAIPGMAAVRKMMIMKTVVR